MRKIFFIVAAMIMFINDGFSQMPIDVSTAWPYDVETQSVDVVMNFLHAVQARDHERVLPLLDEKIEWVQPGNNRISGVKHSRDEVFAMAKTMGNLSEHTLTLQAIKAITVNGNSVACVLTWTAAQPAGKTLTVDNVDVYTIENGRIVKAVVHSENIALEDAFWGQ